MMNKRLQRKIHSICHKSARIPLNQLANPSIKFANFTGSAELKDALHSLSPDERQIVLLSVIGRYKSREIAEMLDMTPGSVRSKLSRSLEKMREILQ